LYCPEKRRHESFMKEQTSKEARPVEPTRRTIFATVQAMSGHIEMDSPKSVSGNIEEAPELAEFDGNRLTPLDEW